MGWYTTRAQPYTTRRSRVVYGCARVVYQQTSPRACPRTSLTISNEEASPTTRAHPTTTRRSRVVVGCARVVGEASELWYCPYTTMFVNHQSSIFYLYHDYPIFNSFGGPKCQGPMAKSTLLPNLSDFLYLFYGSAPIQGCIISIIVNCYACNSK